MCALTSSDNAKICLKVIITGWELYVLGLSQRLSPRLSCLVSLNLDRPNSRFVSLVVVRQGLGEKYVNSVWWFGYRRYYVSGE